MKIKFNDKMIFWFILLLPICFCLENNYGIPFVGYADEFFSLISLLLIISWASEERIDRNDRRIITLLIVLTIVGVISNIFSGLINNIYAILLDAFWQWKVFVCYIVAKNIMRRSVNKDRILNKLQLCSKIFLIIAFLCGIVSCFVNIGMTNGYRYGIPCYYFIFRNEGRFGIIVSLALLFVKIKNKKLWSIYDFMAIVLMILTTKGTVYIIIAIYIMLMCFFYGKRNGGRIRFTTILPMIILGIFVSEYQIQEYLMDSNHPRMLLIKFAFVTALTYFPLGSGFATYGSEMARQYYSPLYVLYGWSNKYGLANGETSSALNDNYLATMIGQFGFIGPIIYYICFLIIFKQLNKLKGSSSVKALVMAIYICLMVSTIATGIVKSSIGVMAFMVLGAVVGILHERK